MPRIQLGARESQREPPNLDYDMKKKSLPNSANI